MANTRSNRTPPKAKKHKRKKGTKRIDPKDLSKFAELLGKWGKWNRESKENQPQYLQAFVKHASLELRKRAAGNKSVLTDAQLEMCIDANFPLAKKDRSYDYLMIFKLKQFQKNHGTEKIPETDEFKSWIEKLRRASKRTNCPELIEQVRNLGIPVPPVKKTATPPGNLEWVAMLRAYVIQHGNKITGKTKFIYNGKDWNLGVWVHTITSKLNRGKIGTDHARMLKGVFEELGVPIQIRARTHSPQEWIDCLHAFRNVHGFGVIIKREEFNYKNEWWRIGAWASRVKTNRKNQEKKSCFSEAEQDTLKKLEV
jgi:hypothetical protein